MGRIRTIKPEFPQSESMGRVSREARLCFILLWTIVDDSGRTRASSRMLASLLYPYDGDISKRVDGWLSELVKERCIILYERDGNKYLEVCKWLIHQKIDRPSKPRIPAFDESSRVLDESSATDQRTKGPKEGTSTSTAAPLPLWLDPGDWETYQLVRKKKGSAFVDDASQSKWMAKMQKRYDDGWDAADMLDQMIIGNWIGPVEEKWKRRDNRPPQPRFLDPEAAYL